MGKGAMDAIQGTFEVSRNRYNQLIAAETKFNQLYDGIIYIVKKGCPVSMRDLIVTLNLVDAERYIKGKERDRDDYL